MTNATLNFTRLGKNFCQAVKHAIAGYQRISGSLTVVLMALVLTSAGCGGADSGKQSHNPSSIVNISLSGANVAGGSAVPKAPGDNLLDLAQPWPTWSGDDSGIRYQSGDDTLLLPGDGSDLILGVNRFDTPLTWNVNYQLRVDSTNQDVAAVLFLFDTSGALVSIPGLDGLAIARSNAPIDFVAPADIAGFYLQVQNQYRAQTSASLSAGLIEGESTVELVGPNLIQTVGMWPDWSGTDNGIAGTDSGSVTIPAASAGISNVIGVRRFERPLLSGVEYELAAESATADQAILLLFLFGTNGSLIPFESDGQSRNWLSTTPGNSMRFVAPEGVSGFAIQIQSTYQAESPATIEPGLRRFGIDPGADGGGPTAPGPLIELDTDWPDWAGNDVGITFDANSNTLRLPAPGVDENPVLGVHHFDTALTAGTTYRLSQGRDADDGTRTVLYLFDADNQILPISTEPGNALTTASLVGGVPPRVIEFVAPDGVASFALQIQSPYFASGNGQPPIETQLAPKLVAVVNETVQLPEQETINFVAFGDQGTGDDNQQRVAAAIETISVNSPLDFTVLLGDNFYENGVTSVNDPFWDSRFELIYTGPMLSQVPFYAVLGNHDYDGNIQAQVDYSNEGLGSERWKMPAVFYYRDFGQVNSRPLVRMVFLDTNPQAQLETEQSQFIADVFAPENGDPIWRVVVGHHPVRNAGLSHGYIDEVADWLKPALIGADVDLYIAAHEHNLQFLQRPGEPGYLISGGGGRGLSASFDSTNPDSRYALRSHGFARVQVSIDGIEVEIFNDMAVRGYSVVLQ